jgi:MCP family monocarboxylic acid transporter-like MFS transporter 10
MIGRISSGFLADRVGPLNVLIVFTLLAGAMTYAWPFAKSVGPLVVIAVIYG